MRQFLNTTNGQSAAFSTASSMHMANEIGQRFVSIATHIPQPRRGRPSNPEPRAKRKRYDAWNAFVSAQQVVAETRL